MRKATPYQNFMSKHPVRIRSSLPSNKKMSQTRCACSEGRASINNAVNLDRITSGNRRDSEGNRRTKDGTDWREVLPYR